MDNGLTGSEAVFGFCAWLTTRKEKTVMSSTHDAAPIADLIKKFTDENKLPDPRENYIDYLTLPKDKNMIYPPSSGLQKSAPPLTRIIRRESDLVRCSKCHSGVIRRFWIFKVIGCLQPKC